MLPVIAATMRPMRQAVVVADELAMKFLSSFNRFTSLPSIFAKSGFDPEITLDQILPGAPFGIHFMMDAETLIDTRPIVIIELSTVVGNRLFPKSPTQQSLKVDVQKYTGILIRCQRTGEDNSGETFQQRAGIQLRSSGFCIKVAEVDENSFKRTPAFLRAFALFALFDNGNGALRREMNTSIERHDLLDCSRTEIDAVVLFQMALYAEPAGIAVFPLQRQDGVNCSELNFTRRMNRSARKVYQPLLPFVAGAQFGQSRTT